MILALSDPQATGLEAAHDRGVKLVMNEGCPACRNLVEKGGSRKGGEDSACNRAPPPGRHSVPESLDSQQNRCFKGNGTRRKRSRNCPEDSRNPASAPPNLPAKLKETHDFPG